MFDEKFGHGVLAWLLFMEMKIEQISGIVVLAQFVYITCHFACLSFTRSYQLHFLGQKRRREINALPEVTIKKGAP